MKKLALILGVLSLVACTDQKVVNYNTARLDNIENYLANNKAVKPSENVDKLVEEGKIEYSEEYLSLEKVRQDQLNILHYHIFLLLNVKFSLYFVGYCFPSFFSSLLILKVSFLIFEPI